MSSPTNTSKGYVLESVVISSTRFLDEGGINILGAVTDIEIFEDLDSPYITAQIAIVDTFRLYDRLDFQGAEYVTITVKQSEEAGSIATTKRFVVSKLISTKKANETTDLIVLHLIEDTSFLSNLINVNRSYTGSPFDIISKISFEYLNKPVQSYTDGSTYQQKLKLIVPNMSPMDAMLWIKNRCTTENGLPLYLFSTFIGQDLSFADLGKMLSATPINKKMPFVYGAARDYSEITDQVRFIPITAYNIEDNEDMYRLISQGLVGADYSFYDTMSAKYEEHKFDVGGDAFSQIEVKENEGITFANDFKLNDKLLQKYQSKHMSQITQSGAYDDGSNRYNSIDQDKNATGHNKRIISRSLRYFLNKSPITITINGRGFMSGDYNRTIGNIVRIIFLANRPNEQGDIKLDMKKSGDYLIYGSKHTLTSTKYDLHLRCVKITSYTDDTILRSIS